MSGVFSTSVTESEILTALSVVIDPDLHKDIVSLGFVKDIKIEGSHVTFKVELTTPACPMKERLHEECKAVVLGLAGVESAEIEMTARVWKKAGDASELLPLVKHTIAVASGKGGVGKSTVTLNLAVALAQTGAKVGILDADVYGPSIPLMMGCQGENPYTVDQKIVPIERFGVKVMSLGFLLEDGQAVMWRGPMVAGTIKQLLSDVAWGELDYLLVDLPPGTGDAPMSLAQLIPLSGVVLVMTPHNVAANIAGKSALLFNKFNTRILGVVENMGTLVCPGCGTLTRVFSGLSGSDLAADLKADYFGSIPLDPCVSGAADQGVPSVIAMPDSVQARAFGEIAGKMAAKLSTISVREDSSQSN